MLPKNVDRPWPGIGRRPKPDPMLLIEGADVPAFERASRNRRSANGSGFCDDIDDAPDGVVAVKHRAAELPRVISIRSIESRGIVERSTPAMIDIVQPAAVDQDQACWRSPVAPKPRTIHRGARAIDASVKATVSCTPGDLRDDFLQRSAAGDRAHIRSAVITDVAEAPTLCRLNCRSAGAIGRRP